MMLTCYRCPKQIAFKGSSRDLFARLFGWVRKGGALLLRCLRRR